MFTMLGQFRKKEGGQALVELALLIPILLIIIFGIVEFGRVFHAHLAVSHASREGARIGVVVGGAGTADSDIKERVMSSAVSLNLSEDNIEITPSLSSRSRGSALTVEVSYQVPLYTPFIGDLIPNPFPIRGSTTMRIE